MNFAQNVCLDDFQVKIGPGLLMTYSSWSRDSLKFVSFRSVTVGPIELQQ